MRAQTRWKMVISGKTHTLGTPAAAARQPGQHTARSHCTPNTNLSQAAVSPRTRHGQQHQKLVHSTALGLTLAAGSQERPVVAGCRLAPAIKLRILAQWLRCSG
jgi:hypothetical protein